MYLEFSGDIPAGHYGAGKMTIWDTGTYVTEKWTDREVMVVLHGERARGRYVLFQTKDNQWMIHRMDPPEDPERQPMPTGWRPMPANRSSTCSWRACCPASCSRSCSWPGCARRWQ